MLSPQSYLSASPGAPINDTTIVSKPANPPPPGNAPPAATISAPSSTARFSVGQTIILTGSASDPEDGVLTDAQLSWIVLVHHNAHTHLSVTLESVPAGLGLTANGMTVTAPPTLTSWARYQLNVDTPTQSDSSGQTWTFASDAGTPYRLWMRGRRIFS